MGIAVHSGLDNVKSSDVTIADDVTITDALTVTGATVLNGTVAVGNATSDTIGFYGVTKVNQPAASGEAALTVTAVTAVTATFVTATWRARINQIVTDLGNLQTKYNQVRGDLVSVGLIKGAA